MKKMKAVVEAGQPLAIYPAGLMCEDGLSTPIPKATYKFLKWMNVDVYMARTDLSTPRKNTQRSKKRSLESTRHPWAPSDTASS
jgi:hypothetical protein